MPLSTDDGHSTRPSSPVGASVGLTELDGEQLIRVVKPEENTEPDVATYARLAGSDFHDGTIEVDVRARLMHWADIEMDEWIHLRAEVSGAGARFYADEDDATLLHSNQGIEV